MAQFTLLCIFTFTVACISSTPVVKPTYYDNLLNSCPGIRNNATFEQIPIVKACQNPAQNAQGDDSKLEVTCILYFHVFAIYCNTSEKVEYFLPVFDEIREQQTRTPKEVCKDMGIIPRVENGTELLKKIFSKEEICVKFCSDNFGMTAPVCKVAHFFSDLINTNIKKSSTVASSASSSVSVSSAPKIASSTSKTNAKKTIETSGNKSIKTDEASLNVSALKHTEKQTQLFNNTKPSTPKEIPGREVSVSQAGAINPSSPEATIALNGKTSAEKQENTAEAPTPPPKKTNAAVVNEEYISENSAGVPPQNSEVAVADTNGEAKYAPNDDGPAADEPIDDEDLENMNMNINGNGKVPKPETIDDGDSAVSYAADMNGDSYFFTYFMVLCLVFVVGYVCYHNKQKILALILEGRRGRKQFRGRRPNSANYHKLDSNLEEAITSSCSKNPSNVIY